LSEAYAHVPFTLPVKPISKAGEVFDPNEDVWRFSSSSRFVKIRFTNLKEFATDDFLTSLKAAMAGALRKQAPTTCSTMMEKGVAPLLEHAHAHQGERVGHITLGMVQAYGLSLDERHKLNLDFVKMVSKALAIHGDPAHGIDVHALNWLAKQKSPGNPIGEAVLTMDPINGPLLMSEDRILMRALHAAFEANELPKHVYLKILLFRLSAMRPAQVADLKCKDLTLREGVYCLAFPQVKERGGGWRETFETWALIPEVGALLAGFIREQQISWAQLGMGDDLPVFVNPQNRDPIRTYHYVGNTMVKGLPCYLSNLKAPDPTTGKRVQIRSPRTGQVFKVNMRRFRMSLATWALIKGGTLLEVAKILGHAGVSPALNSYAAIDMELLEEMDHKMAVSEVRTAGYFRGELCDGPGVGSALYPESFGGQAVGHCKSPCAQRKPYSCYTCRQFQALMHGPHEQVLADLEAERSQVVATGGTFQSDTHDQTIGAVKQVIDKRDAKLRRDGLTIADLKSEGA